MKTITVSFVKNGETIASTVGRFETLPGKGRVVWHGQPFAGFKPDHGYAETFVDAMRDLAERAVAMAVVKENGDWQVFEE